MNNQIFVFGSNLSGIHGKGAALWAKRAHGAVQGQWQGLHGRSYAIPTKGHYVRGNWGGYFEYLPLEQIKIYVSIFCDFANSHTEYTYFLTPIGCGLAGFTPQQIAPLFEMAWLFKASTIIWPPEFLDILQKA